LILGCIAFPVLTVMTAMDLNSLENGTQASVSLVVPIGFLYKNGGYWTAVLSIPLFGLLVCGALFWKIRQLSAAAKNVD
jgi:hypothetical protein